MLSINQDAKTKKGVKRGYLTGVMYLAPASLSGHNLCPNSTPGCRDECLNTAGRGAMNSVQRARMAKAKRLYKDRVGFMQDVCDDVRSLERKAIKAQLIPLVRLNGTSDVAWEHIRTIQQPNIMAEFPGIQFYDYTKSFKRMLNFLDGKLPSNYHLTFSRSECNEKDAMSILERGGNVAVVFSTKKGNPLPLKWRGYNILDGDVDDVRPSDPRGLVHKIGNTHAANGSASIGVAGRVIGLRAKGKARKDTTGFVVQV